MKNSKNDAAIFIAQTKSNTTANLDSNINDNNSYLQYKLTMQCYFSANSSHKILNYRSLKRKKRVDTRFSVKH